MKNWKSDLAIVGAGPAGQKAAIQGAKLGKDVIVIDAGARVGGACLHHGTIPSKTLREAILAMTGFRERSFEGASIKGLEEITIGDLSHRLEAVTSKLAAVVEHQFTRNGVVSLHGRARFRQFGELEVTGPDGEVLHRVQAQKIVLATGSSPRMIDGIQFDEDCILDSDRLLRLAKLPRSMLVLGGGVIGSEYATMLAALGVEVTLLDKVDRPLRMLDHEVCEEFRRVASQLGVSLCFGKSIERVERIEDRARVTLEGGQVLEAETALIALGRTANVAGLELDKIGLEVDSRGRLPVNAMFQTAWPNLYACGDLIGGPLASTAMEQGRLAVLAAFSERSPNFPEHYPFGIYTIPEISWIGPSEQELRDQGIRYAVGRAHYAELARPIIAGEAEGFLKFLFHAETLEVLACHVCGHSATEIIHVVQAAMHFNAKIDYFVHAIFNYPTFAEALRVAALDGMNRGLRRAAEERKVETRELTPTS